MDSKILHLRFANKAFTLAEVLITLAIIGIVAVLTIPSLVANYQKRQYVIYLKKNYTNMTNAFREAMAKDGVTNFQYTELAKAKTDPAIEQELRKIFKINRFFPVARPFKNDKSSDSIECNGTKSYKYLSGRCVGSNQGALGHPNYRAAMLNDGTIMYYYPWSHNFSYGIETNRGIIIKKVVHILAIIIIDTNGVKKPNTFGRDVHTFYLGEDGILYSPGWNADMYWHSTSGFGSYMCSPETNSNVQGDGCAARIIDEGWQMTY